MGKSVADINALFAAMTDDMESRIAETGRRKREMEEAYRSLTVPPETFGSRSGPVHAASILSWLRIAEIAGVPHVPGQKVASIPMDDAWTVLDDGEPTPEGIEQIRLAVAAISDPGSMWRSDLCAPAEVKWSMGRGDDLPAELPLMFDDERMMDMHYGMPTLDIIKRPRVTPARHAGYPAEFRVFIGGHAKGTAASWYYPQAGRFDPAAELERAMETSVAYAERLYATRANLGLVPWLPTMGEPDEGIGATIDFMLTTDGEVVLIDAGPGWGFNAHPCCFIDRDVEGRRWHLAEGVEPR